MLLFNKKILLGLIIISIIFSGVFITGVKKVQAVPVEVITDPTTSIGLNRIATILTGTLPGAQQDNKKAGILMKAAKVIIRQFTQSIVTWINNGFKGNPSFITNTEQFLLNTADVTVGDFLMNDPALSFLCDPFKLQIKLAIGLQYRPFKEQIKCSFTSAVGNVKDAMNKFTNGDFIGGGGWDSWLQMTTVPQNNQMGAMMIAQGELDARLSGNKEIQLAEANWGGGFMSWKYCPEAELNALDAGETGDELDTALDTAYERDQRANRYSAVTGQQRGDDNCVIKTPGGVIANKINWADTSTIRELELADNFNEIVYALANQVLLKGMGALSESGLLGGKKPTYEDSYNEYMQYLSGLDTEYNASTNTGYYNSDGSINYNQTFTNRAIALETINAGITVETQYLATQSALYTALTSLQNAFNSSTCSEAVKTGVVSQITGDYTGIKDLTWNLKDIARESALATSNISLMSGVQNQVQNTTNDSAVISLVQPLTTMKAHSATTVNSYSSGGTAYNQIKDWIVSKINSNGCVSITTTDLGI